MSYVIIYDVFCYIQQSSERECYELASLFYAYQQLINFSRHKMNITDESFFDEYKNETLTWSYTEEITMWSITAVAVAIMVIVTIVIVVCIVKKTPERELEVTRDTGAAGPTTLRGRAVAYYNQGCTSCG